MASQLKLFPYVLVIPVLCSIILGILNSENKYINEFLSYQVLSSFKTGIICLELTESNNEIIAFGDLRNNTRQGNVIKNKADAYKLCSSIIIVNDKAAFYSGLLRGTVGIGETYHQNKWSYDKIKYDLGDILTLIYWNVLNNAG
eukprot:335513_1